MIHCLKCKRYIYISMITSLIASTSVFFAVRAADIADRSRNNIPVYIVGGIFWSGLIITYVLSGMANHNRKRAIELGYGSDMQDRIGMFCFFRNAEAKLADIVMACSVLLIIIELIAKVNNHFLVLMSIFLAVFSIHMHGILNGKSYNYIKESKDI